MSDDDRVLNIGGVEIPEERRVTLPHIDVRKFQEERDAEWRTKLEEARKKFLGRHDTGKPCVCSSAYTISDHASEADRSPRRIQDVRMGPDLESQEQKYHLFMRSIRHKYRCDTCGLKYDGDVMEGVRGYVPLEKR